MRAQMSASLLLLRDMYHGNRNSGDVSCRETVAATSLLISREPAMHSCR